MVRFGRHVRQQYAGFLALFIALGGVSYAAISLPQNSVGSKQIKRGAVKNSDLGKNAVTSAKVKDGSLLSADFKPGQPVGGPPGAAGPQGLKGDKGDAGANGINGTNGAMGPVGPTFGRSVATSFCNPSSTTFVACTTTGSIELPTSGRVLLIGTSSWDNNANGFTPDRGACRLRVDGTTTVGPTSVDFGQITATHAVETGGSVAANGVSDVLPAGAHTFAFECNESDADVALTDTSISAVLLGGA